MAQYTVRSGDSLWAIMRAGMGRNPTEAEMRHLAAVNGVRVTGSGANMQAAIRPGQVLELGGDPPRPAARPAPRPAARPAPRPAPRPAAGAQQAAAQKAAAAKQAAAKSAAAARTAAAQKAAAARAAEAKRAQQAAAAKAATAKAQKAAADRAHTQLWQSVVSANPWLRTLGISTDRLKQLAATSSGASELLDRLRAEPAVKKRTQAMYRSDGSRRFSSEAELFQWENQTREVLRQAGVDVDRQYATPQTLIGFAEGNLSPDEVRTRLQVWQGVKQSGQIAREVFYVYAGLSPTDDDLYEALVDRGAAQDLDNAFNKAVGEKMSGPGAWQGWIDRARQAGQARLVTIFNEARQNNATYAATIQRVMNVDPAFANDIMDALYTGGDPEGGDFLDLTSMLDAYELMAVGAAAQGAGLELPTLDRLKEIRAQGVEKSRMMSAYQQFGLDRNRLNAAVQRARGETFTTRDFEAAAFFADPEATRELEAGEAYMQSAGKSQGQFQFSRGERGQFVQSGLSAR